MSFPSSTTFTTATSTSSSATQTWETDWPNVLTTPYTYRPQCSTLLRPCSALRANPEFPAADPSFLCMRTAGESWKSCQPRTNTIAGAPTGSVSRYGEMEGGPHGGTDFGIGTRYHAAVCPDGWWALDVGLTWKDEVRTSATCCSRGDSVGEDVFSLYNVDEGNGEREGDGKVCVGYPTVVWTGEGSTRMDGGMRSTAEVYYPGWKIGWHERDLATLSPPWPTLTNNMLIPTWTTGMRVQEGVYDNRGSFSASTTIPASPLRTKTADVLKRDKHMALLKLWLPIGLALGLAVVVLGLWRLRSRRLKREGRGLKADDSRRVVRPARPVDCDRLPLPLAVRGEGVEKERK